MVCLVGTSESYARRSEQHKAPAGPSPVHRALSTRGHGLTGPGPDSVPRVAAGVRGLIVEAGRPLYRQVADRVAADLAAGDLTVGDRLPSERVLCARLGVSRVTLRAALHQLVDQGLVSAEAARGWFVAAVPSSGDPAGPVLPSAVAGFTDNAVGRGQAVTSRVLLSQVRAATHDEADAFSTVAGAPLFELRRVRLVAGLVIAVDHSRIPADVRPGLLDADFTATSLYDLLRSGTPPVVPTGADYAVEALPASPQEAGLLDLPAGVPLLVATQRTRDQHGVVFELGRTAYRGDRFRFRATLGAPPPGSAPGPS